MRELESLGAVHGHEANRIVVIFGHKGNYATGLSEVFEVVHEFGEFGGLVDLLSLPVVDKLQRRLEDWRRRIEGEFSNDDIDGSPGLRSTGLDLLADPLHGRQDIGASLNAIERRGERYHLRFAIIACDSSQNLPQLVRVDVKAWQARHPQQADVIAAGDDRLHAGEEVPSLWRVGDIHVLDDERNASFGQLLRKIIFMRI